MYDEHNDAVHIVDGCNIEGSAFKSEEQGVI